MGKREIITYFMVSENSDKLEGRGATVATFITRNRAAAVQWAKGRGRGGMGQDEYMWELYALEWDGKVYDLGLSNPLSKDPLPLPSEAEDQERLEALAKLSDRERKLLGLPHNDK